MRAEIRGAGLHAFVTAPGLEAVLAGEIGAEPAGPGLPRWPGVITTRRVPSRPIDPVFARQQLPAAELMRADSVSALASAAGAAAMASGAAAAAGEAPIALHVFVPDPRAYATLAGRAALVGEALAGRLPRRRLAASASASWGDVVLVQAALVGRAALLVSVARPLALAAGGFDLALWPAGIAPVEPDRRAPSRAYGKLEEALAWIGEAPAAGQLCVDLGGAPGGWAWTALKRGARVVAVDRARLEPPAAGHAALTMLRGDAFKYEPPAPVDWLLCDVICDPGRTVALVERWMRAGLCRRVVATMKFKGRTGYGAVDEARRRLGAIGWRLLRLKHLHRHQNEVAILAAR